MKHPHDIGLPIVQRSQHQHRRPGIDRDVGLLTIDNGGKNITVAIVYGAFVCLAQSDLKRLVAYSSVSHMGFVTLGLFALNQNSLEGSILQMIKWGIVGSP